MRFTTRTVVALALSAVAPAFAQTQIKPRVILMLDTSGSMVSHLTDNTATFGDGSTLYKDSGINSNIYYRGVPTGSVTCDVNGNNCMLTGSCSTTNFDGQNSRMFAAKQAINSVLNGSGDIDWGLMRYTGTTCAASATPFTPRGGSACATDFDCNNGEICNTGTGKCGTDSNFCNFLNGMGNHTNNYLELNNTCGAVHNLGITYSGNCGTAGTAGTGLCGSVQTCYGAGDCTGGACTALAGSAASACTCTGAAQCPTGWSCQGVGGVNRCVYNLGCQSDGGFILVNPATSPSSALFPFIDNVEDYTPSGGGVVNPELRADGNTPLAGAARTATNWYNTTIGGDAQKLCRPYILVQITDGFDTCDGDATNGPIAAAQGFVGATIAGAKQLNKVYVIGLAFGGVSSTSLDQIAAAGGTTKARLANNATDIEAALSDIVSSSVLVEKCNRIDDNCNGQCDENFPDVLVTNPAPDGSSCSNPHAANSCNNGALAGTHCFATGTFVCSADTLSEVCSAPTCATMPSLCATAETCNGVDDDCNGVIDDCTPFVPNSCCVSACPACNPTGVPQPETCNGCDDDCDGIADNHLTDTGIACGSNVGDCAQGTTFCCQQVSPTVGTCTTDPKTTQATAPAHMNPDKLFCLGGVGPSAEMCDGTDHDCDGTPDDISRACYPFGTGSPGVGICKNGTQQCNAVACGTQPNACCPAGWPAGKTCPGASSYGACSGAVGPQPEVCNGIDDNCDGTVDNNVTDPWVGTACCPTGNNADCTNTGTGSRCMLGVYQCVAGAKTCVGGVAKSPETCNSIDDDCNGKTDDNIAGNGQPCSGGSVNTTGPCTAAYTCTGVPGPGPNGLTCTQVVGPKPEVCNGIDDNCDGTVDNMLMDPRVGVVGGTPCVAITPLPGTMFPNGQPQPPCNPGVTACVNGAVVCQGEVTPMPNQCNGMSTDCTGTTNNAMCPTGFQCVQGNCVMPCGGGEFPCPGGFVCDMATNLCIPDKCAVKNCPAGFLCNIDSMGNANCVDPCTRVNCGTDYQCVNGSCVDCHQFGCASGEICVGTPGKCKTDPCAGVMCPANQFCDSNGTCVMMCSTCPSHEICIGGMCQMDPCQGMMCNTDEVCTVQGNPPTGVCVSNMCGEGCASGQVCCGGSCRTDQCDLLQCPAGSKCALDSACEPSCMALPPDDKVVGAGGGGTACSTVPGEAGRGSGLTLMLLLGIAVTLARRGRRAA